MPPPRASRRTSRRSPPGAWAWLRTGSTTSKSGTCSCAGGRSSAKRAACLPAVRRATNGVKNLPDFRERATLPRAMVGAALACSLCLVAFASPASARPAKSTPPDDDRRIAERLLVRFDSLRTALAIPGLAVAIVRDTTILVARGFGLADREQAVPVTPDTPFNIASVTKPISAVVALRLVERGILD